jgi:antitoxin ParD1/3/4
VDALPGRLLKHSPERRVVPAIGSVYPTAMSTLQLTLPDEVKHFVDEQVARGGFGNADEYVCALLRREKESAGRDHLRGLLQAGLESGEPLEIDDAFWREREATLATKISGT